MEPVQVNRSAVAKKAETLYVNLQGLIRRVGIERVGFLTLTFPDHVTDKDEASRRFNSLASGVLRPEHLEFVAVPERQGSGRFHFHLATAFPWDIRTGFDFAACANANTAKRGNDMAAFRYWQNVYFKSANQRLHDWWTHLRLVAIRYKFGRCETLPVLSNAAALARYVGAYVTTASNARRLSDKGMRTVRYSLIERCASVRWSWADGHGRNWRRGMQILGSALELEHDEFKTTFGKKWAWRLREYVTCFGEKYEQALAYVSQIPDWADFQSRAAFVTKLFTHLNANNPSQTDEVPCCAAGHSGVNFAG